MIVKFGLDFDTQLPDPAQNRIGHVTIGTAGMLAILETQLGLTIPEMSTAKRLVQYHACLNRLNSPERFYNKSYGADALSVTRTLLGWRDQWYEDGWTGTFDGKIDSRLKDLAEVEAEARDILAPCIGQRLQAVIEVLQKRKTQIEKVELVDAFADLPYLWQQVVAQLGYTQLDVNGRKPAANDDSDLGRLQRALWKLNTNEGEKPKNIDLKGDGSVVVLTARSKAVSARLLAEHIQSLESIARVAVLTGKNGADFDDALESIDAARCGLQNRYQRRPALQVLPLALHLLWEPLDPGALLQFLTHPVGPLPARVRRRLAKAVSESPGVGGRSWQEAIAKIRETEKEKRGAGGEEIKKLLGEIDYWLTSPRYDTEKGAPLTEFAGRCERVAAWLTTMLWASEETPEQALFAQAHHQAVDLCEALDYMCAQGQELIDRHQLNRLVDQVAGAGGSLSDRFAEMLHVPAADNPAVFTSEWEEIIWWDFSMPELPHGYPWTKTELSALENSGVHLQYPDDRLNYLAGTWLRPVMSARKRLIFVLHYTVEEHHPLWDQINTCCRGWIELDVEELLQRGESIFGFAVQSQPLEPKPLPRLKRWWQLGDGTLLAPRKSESYSSLDTFIKSPYQWVLRYKVYLKAGTLAELPSGSLLKGSLVHRLFEDFFDVHKKWKSLDDTQIKRWIDKRLPVLLEEEGALLLQPGRAAEKEAFEEIARQALITLCLRLNETRVNDIAMETYHSTPFLSGTLNGYIDMLLTCADGSEKVLDMKWSYAKYRIEELKENRQLQLATYAYLRKKIANSGDWPPQAYFIIDGSQLLTQDEKSFPGSLGYMSSTGETTADLWRRFEATWHWRRKQMDTGLVEVTVTGTEPDAASVPPEDGMPIEDVNDRFSEYGVLTGWGEE
ncbi:MAG: PD-(D/E)XK nuclease family protein, partial [Desulfobacterales bacterium]